jgi:hypothetical protein
VYRIGANKTVSSFLEPEAVVQLGLCRPLDQAVIQRELTGDHVSTIQAASHGVLLQTRNFHKQSLTSAASQKDHVRPSSRAALVAVCGSRDRFSPPLIHENFSRCVVVERSRPPAAAPPQPEHRAGDLEEPPPCARRARRPVEGPRRARGRRPGHPADHPAAERPLRPRPCGGRRREPPSAAHRGGRPGRPHPPAGAPHRRRGDEVPPGAIRRFQLLREYWSLNRGDLGQHLSRRPGPALFTPDRELANKTTTGSSCIYIPSL